MPLKFIKNARVKKKLMPLVKAIRHYMLTGESEDMDNLVRRLSEDTDLLDMLDKNHGPWVVTKCLMAVHYLRSMVTIDNFLISDVIEQAAASIHASCK